MKGWNSLSIGEQEAYIGIFTTLIVGTIIFGTLTIVLKNDPYDRSNYCEPECYYHHCSVN